MKINFKFVDDNDYEKVSSSFYKDYSRSNPVTNSKEYDNSTGVDISDVNREPKGDLFDRMANDFAEITG